MDRNNGIGQVAFDTCAKQPCARVGKPRHSSVGNKSDIFSGGDAFHEFGCAHRFVMLMVTDERFSDAEMFQQVSRMPRVFRRDYVRRSENFKGSFRDVVKIPDRRAYDVKHFRSSIRIRFALSHCRNGISIPVRFNKADGAGQNESMKRSAL